MTITQIVSKLNEILSAHGDLQVEIEARFATGDIEQVAKASAHGVVVVNQPDTFKRAMITSDDGNAG